MRHPRTVDGRQQRADRAVDEEIADDRQREQQGRRRHILWPASQQRYLGVEPDQLRHDFGSVASHNASPRLYLNHYGKPLHTQIISTPAGLAQLAAQLGAQPVTPPAGPVIGLDTEFLRERTYRAELCLLQLSAGSDAWCVDPIALPDLTPLRELLCTPRAVKVMHASRQDLEVLYPAI